MNHIQGILAGDGLTANFTGPLVGADAAGRFRKNRQFYMTACRYAGVPEQQCLIVDDTADALDGAKASGCRTALIWRKIEPPPTLPLDCALVGDLPE